MIVKRGTFAAGYTEVVASLPRAYLLAQLALTANGNVRVRFGPSGGPWVSPDIFLTPGVPYVLPQSEMWLEFDAGSQLGIEATFTSGSLVGVLAGFEPA